MKYQIGSCSQISKNIPERISEMFCIIVGSVTYDDFVRSDCQALINYCAITKRMVSVPWLTR